MVRGLWGCFSLQRPWEPCEGTWHYELHEIPGFFYLNLAAPARKLKLGCHRSSSKTMIQNILLWAIKPPRPLRRTHGSAQTHIPQQSLTTGISCTHLVGVYISPPGPDFRAELLFTQPVVICSHVSCSLEYEIRKLKLTPLFIPCACSSSVPESAARTWSHGFVLTVPRLPHGFALVPRSPRQPRSTVPSNSSVILRLPRQKFPRSSRHPAPGESPRSRSHGRTRHDVISLLFVGALGKAPELPPCELLHN